MSMSAQVDAYIRKNGLHPDCVDVAVFKTQMISEMNAGLSGDPSSLFMIPTYLTAEGQLPEGATAVALDIGGTNLRVALTEYREGRVHILHAEEYPVPGAAEEISKDEFFEALATKMLPYIRETSHVGVCFSHPAEILPNRDGRLYAFSKEIKVTDSAGMCINAGLAEAVRKLGVSEEKSYVLLNDTAAVLLGGAASTRHRCWDGYIGFVLGTGMNIAYAEKTAAIGKLTASYGHSGMLINMEAGEFIPRPSISPLDRALDEATVNPGSHQLEKMLSGRYLGQLCLMALKKAAVEGLLTPASGVALAPLTALETATVSGFLKNYGTSSTLAELLPEPDDREAALAICGAVVARGAKLAAAAVAAIMEKADAGKSPECPTCMTAEGSTFYKLHGFREHFDSYTQEYINKQAGRYVEIVTAENAALVGTALGVLLAGG